MDDSEARFKQRVVGTIILLFIVGAIALLIFSFESGKEKPTPQPDQQILAAADVAASQVPTGQLAPPMVDDVQKMPPVDNDVEPQVVEASSAVADTSTPHDVVKPVSGDDIDKSFGQVSDKSSAETAPAAVTSETSDLKVVPKKVTPNVLQHKTVSRKHLQTSAKHKVIKAKTVKPKVVTAKGAAAAKIKSGWSVKLGSFSSPINANNLVKKVRAAGFKVYTVLFFSEKHGVLTKVLVGPKPDKASATQTLQKIANKFNIHGILIKK